MIPLKDDQPVQRFPLINYSLIIANVLIFLYQQTLHPREVLYLVSVYGLVPAELIRGVLLFLEGSAAYEAILWPAAFNLLSATFLHGGWLHLLGNMIFLWVFGDNIEDALGSIRYLFTYLLMGAGGSLFHVITHPFSDIPLIGASGAIAGVLGCYFILYPRAKVLTLIPLGFFITFARLPAVLFLAFWFVLQLFNALLAPGMMGQPVAWWAHVGGFIMGLVVGILASSKQQAIR